MKKVDQKIVLVTRPTRLQSLRRRYNTAGQAKFMLAQNAQREMLRAAPAASMDMLREVAEEAVVDFEREDDAYERAVESIRSELTDLLPLQTVDREIVPTLLFGPHDIVVTVGQDGLVANTAKYAVGLPIIGINPDAKRFDGVLLPFKPDQARRVVMSVLEAKAKMREVTLAQAILPDGQRLLAFNDLFIGAQTHVSARYTINASGKSEPQSSSGVIVSTGAGSTGWLSSIYNMVNGVAHAKEKAALKLAWEDPRLAFVVREPFVSLKSGASIVSGMIERGQELLLTSNMASEGVIFSDGIQNDFLAFNSGAVARISAAKEKARLVVR